jgi:hypothetical protein
MRRLSSIVALLLLLIAVAPALACVARSAMSAEEAACCRSMHGQCGEMAKMGCCRTELRTDETPQVAAIPPASEVKWICVAQLAPLAATPNTITPALLQAPQDFPPPGLLTAKITVLRI